MAKNSPVTWGLCFLLPRFSNVKLALRPFLAAFTVAVLGVGSSVMPVGPGVQEAVASTNVGTGECAQTVGTPGNVTVTQVTSTHSITSGGTSITASDQTATTYCVLDFTGSSSWTVPQNLSLEYFVVSGGGGGGGGTFNGLPRGGGGGGGGGITRGGIDPGSEFSVATGDSVAIVVGGGGVGGPANGEGGHGESSSITLGNRSVVAGGGLRANRGPGAGAASGTGDIGSQAGGSVANRLIGSGGGGGGGAAAGVSASGDGATTVGGNGGSSWRIRILGDSTAYGSFAGGGGGGSPTNTGSSGGSGSGGNGANYSDMNQFNGRPGTANTGGGGGGGSVNSANTNTLGTGGSGGSGRVIIRYTPPPPPTQLALTSSAPVTPQSEVKLSPAPVIQIRDSSNTLVAGASNAVTATIASGQPGATLSGNVVNAVNGVATFSNLTITGPVGNYTLEFTSPNLETATSQSLSLAKRAITIEGGSPSVNFGTLFTPTALYCDGSTCSQDLGSGRTVDQAQTKYTYTGTQGTVYGPSLEKPVNAGRYNVEPFDLVITGGSADDYDITYQPGTLEIRRVSRTLAFTSPSSLTLQYGATATVVAEPSVGDGAITYSVGASTACSVDSSGVVTVTSASGTCQLSSTIATGTNHLTATTTSPVTVTVSTRPITVSVTPQSVTVGGVVSSSPTVTSGALQLSDTLSSATFEYEGTGSTTYAASTTAPTAVGTYSVTPSVAVFGSGLAANYVITYAPGTLEIVAVPPPAVASGGGGAAPAPEVVTPPETPRGPRTPRALPVVPNTSPVGQITQRVGARTDLNAPAVATIGGRPANLVVTPSGPGGISLSAGSIQLGLRVNESEGGNVQMDTPSRSPELVVPRGKSAAVSGGGFFPGSSVQLWLPGMGNDSRETARILVRPDGTFSSEVTLEAGSLELPVPTGRQALTMVGFDEEGNETVIDMTINVSQGVPAPEMNRQTGELPDLSAGQSLATSAGMPETVSITAIPDAGIVAMEGADWVISVSVGDSNGSVENAEGTVQLSMGQASGGSATGSGFLPGTLATVWFFSEPTLAATVTVDDNGEFSAEFLVDARLIFPGEHTLQVQGVGTDGFIKAANVGVVVEEPVVFSASGASALMTWVAVIVAVIAMLVVVTLLASRRRRRFAEGAFTGLIPVTR